MFSNLKSRLDKATLAAMVAATLATGLVVGTGVAQAQPITIGNGTPCTYGGTSYPEGSVITDARGWKFMCISGEWEEVLDAVAVRPTQSTAGGQSAGRGVTTVMTIDLSSSR